MDVVKWRKDERQRLKAVRLAMPDYERSRARRALRQNLLALLLELDCRSVGFYWPIMGEPDVRRLSAPLLRRKWELSLPWARERNIAVDYRRWCVDSFLAPDAWGIPAPVDNHKVKPKAILVPMLGFDRQGYRLGYGSGIFDRTLDQALPPLAIGVGFDVGRLESCHPQTHDRPMQWLVSDKEVVCTKIL